MSETERINKTDALPDPYIERHSVCDTKNTRIFVTAGADVHSSFYSPADDDEKGASVVFNAQDRTITLTVNKDISDISAVDIAGKLWGPDARGDERSATSPEDLLLAEKDLIKAVKAVETAIEPAKDRRIEERVKQVKESLREKPINSRIAKLKKYDKKKAPNIISMSALNGGEKENDTLSSEKRDEPAADKNVTQESTSAVPQHEEPADEFDGSPLRSEDIPGFDELPDFDSFTEPTENAEHYDDHTEKRPMDEPVAETPSEETVEADDEYDILKLLEDHGLVYMNEDMSVYVVQDAKSLLNEDGKMKPEELEKLKECMWKTASVDFDPNDGFYKTTKILILEPNKEKPGSVNVYELQMTAHEQDKESEHEDTVSSSASRVETEKPRSRRCEESRAGGFEEFIGIGADKAVSLARKADMFLVKIKEGIALGAAIALVMSHGGPVKTMDDIKERDEAYKEIKEKMVKVRSFLGLDKTSKKDEPEK